MSIEDLSFVSNQHYIENTSDSLVSKLCVPSSDRPPPLLQEVPGLLFPLLLLPVDAGHGRVDRVEGVEDEENGQGLG